MMRTRTAVALVALTAAGFTAAGVYGNTYTAPQDTGTPLYRCIQPHVNNTDTACITYEQNRQTGVPVVITLQPGQTLD